MEKKTKTKLHELFQFFHSTKNSFTCLFTTINFFSSERSQHRNIFQINTLLQTDADYFQHFASKSIGFTISSTEIYLLMIVIMPTCFTICFFLLLHLSDVSCYWLKIDVWRNFCFLLEYFLPQQDLNTLVQFAGTTRK